MSKRKLSIESRLGLALLCIFTVLILVSNAISSIDPAVVAIQDYPDVNIVEFGDKEISRGDVTKKQVIFTFDGGEGSESGEEILAALAKHKVKGTFFLTGKFIERNPVLVRRIIKEGHEVFNHTYDHPYLTTLSSAALRKQFDDMEATLMNYAGVSPKPFFRAPYGDRNEHVLKVALDNGYQSVYWTADLLDWKESEGETPKSVLERVTANLDNGAIFLMHIGDSITGKVLDQALTKIEEKGFKAVSLTQGLPSK